MTASTSSPTSWSDEELRAKVGQLFIVGFNGHTPSDDIEALISEHKVGAIILFQRNIESSEQLLRLTNSLQEIARRSGHSQELFIGIDQENGLITRIPESIAAQLPGPMALAATGDALNAYKTSLATAETLTSFGINFNYAPIADVNSEPKNPVIGVRSPSDDPETAGRFVSSQVKGSREGGVIPCVKHFPGHGDTATDSHYGLPVIQKSKAQLDACELIPFRRAVVEGVDAVMTAHIELPQLGDASQSEKLPASLNPDAIGILRQEMKFDGLIVSDCLEMDGVRAKYGTEKSAVLALKAGTDCVMICHTISAQIGAIKLAIEAVKSGELSKESIQQSISRVEKLKTKYARPLSSAAVQDASSLVRSQSLLASQIYAQSTTVVRCDVDSFPISAKLAGIVFLHLENARQGGGAEEKSPELHVKIKFIDILRKHNPDITDFRVSENTPLSPEAEDKISTASVVILATKNASLDTYQKDFALSLGKKLEKKLVVVATSDPYDFLDEVEEIKNYIVTYEPTIPALHSAANVIFGITKAIGRLPVGIQAGTEGIRQSTGSDRDVQQICKLWREVFPKWPIDKKRMAKMLSHDFGKHWLHDKGFCISFNVGGMGKIAAVGVLEESRGKGLGTALVTRAKEVLKSENFDSLGIGSVFPRFWPGIPIEVPQEYKDFFLHRGFRLSTEPTARDLFRDIRIDVASDAVIEKVSKLPLNFSPWSAELYEECMTKQRANFNSNQAWVKAYERLAAENQYQEVMVAFDSETGAQVGWTMMCSPSAILHEDFAFLPLAPSKDRTGLIACVGVDKAARGKGVGLALLVKAMENMRERGVEGVLIDWVVIRGFYENLGFVPIWEYEGYNW